MTRRRCVAPALTISICLAFAIACNGSNGTDSAPTGSATIATPISSPAPESSAAGMSSTEGAALHDQLNTADLRVDVVGQPDPVVVGHDLTYAISVTNQGRNPASSTFVDIRLPDGLALVADSRCRQEQSGVIRCSLGEITAHSSSTLTATVHVGQVTGQASATFVVGNLLGPDANETDNTKVILTEVHGE